MLQTTKAISVTGTSIIEGQQAVYFSAQITTESAGATNVSQSISDAELYRVNRSECRKDFDDFQKKVWEIEDEMMG